MPSSCRPLGRHSSSPQTKAAWLHGRKNLDGRRFRCASAGPYTGRVRGKIVRLLLDTHIALWWLQNDRKLSRRCRARIAGASEIYVSSASLWETAIKVGAGKLQANLDDLVTQIALDGSDLRINAAS